jgi:hydrogenase maturation factor
VLIHLGFALERLTEAEAAETDATRRFLFDGEGAVPFADEALGDAVAVAEDS